MQKLVFYKEKIFDINLSDKEIKAISSIPSQKMIYKNKNFKEFINNYYFTLLEMYNNIIVNNNTDIKYVSFDDFCNFVYDETN